MKYIELGAFLFTALLFALCAIYAYTDATAWSIRKYEKRTGKSFSVRGVPPDNTNRKVILYLVGCVASIAIGIVFFILLGA